MLKRILCVFLNHLETLSTVYIAISIFTLIIRIVVDLSVDIKLFFLFTSAYNSILIKRTVRIRCVCNKHEKNGKFSWTVLCCYTLKTFQKQLLDGFLFVIFADFKLYILFYQFTLYTYVKLKDSVRKSNLRRIFYSILSLEKNFHSLKLINF